MRLKPPFFSIIIPTYARPRQLVGCLRSLARLDYPRDHFEVIVVDDGSGLSLQPVIAPFRDHFDMVVLTQMHAGPATARNAGAAQARGQFLAFVDDDCMVASNWLQALATRFVTVPDHAIGGQTINALPVNSYSTATQLIVDYLYTYYNADHNHAQFLSSNNVAMPLDRFCAVGGFDTTFPLAAGEDREFCNRWLCHGYRMTYAPEAIVYHAHALTLSTFWRQHFNYGRGAFCFHRRYSWCNRGRTKLEPLAFYIDLLRYPFSQKQAQSSLLLALLLAQSQAATAAGFLWQGIRQVDEKIH
jgi:GT2 family glycosyltransferase